MDFDPKHDIQAEKRCRAPSVDDSRTLQKHESAAQYLNAEGSVTKDLPSLSRETRPWTPAERPQHSGTDSGPDDAEGADDEPTFPEGGLRAWSVVAGSWLALFSGLGIMNTIATFHLYIGSNQLAGYSDGAVGWIFSVYTFLGMSPLSWVFRELYNMSLLPRHDE